VQQLHLIGSTTDLEGLVFTGRRGSKSGGYVVKIDDALMAKIEETLAKRREATGETEEDDNNRAPRPPRPESGLTPREMQARLRSGRSVTQVAVEAGVEEDWVARFAVPILAEQARVVDRAMEMVFSKPRLGPSALPLGTSVALNALDRGLRFAEDEFRSSWSAYQVLDTIWVVRFAYLSRRRVQAAEWELDLRDGALNPRNRLATDLGYVDKSRRRRRVVFALEPSGIGGPAPAAPRTRRAPKPATSPAAKPAASKPAGSKKRTTAKRAAPKKATGSSRKRAPANKRAPAKKLAAKRSATRRPAKKTAAAKRKAAPARGRARKR
jgi:hypothetical protein